MNRPIDLQSLCEVSARLGREHALVQGPGGNASLKIGSRLWVKGSGLWLSEALERPVFLPLSLPVVLAQLESGEANSFDAAIIDGESYPGLRPSIETALHALMPHPAVIHAHAANSITTAVLYDGKARTAGLLNGVVRWAWINYRRPGGPLAAAISENLRSGPADVLLLENHGIVVGGETPETAEALLRMVEKRLEFSVRPLPDVPPDTSGRGGEHYALLPEISGLALDSELVNILAAAPLMPDQVVFLGGAVPVCAPRESVAEAAARTLASFGVTPAVVLKPEVGIYALSGRSQGASSLIDCLYEVARRVPSGARVRGLSPKEAAELIGWDAEKYRQILDRQRR